MLMGWEYYLDGAKTGKAFDKVTFGQRFEGSESSSNAHIPGRGNSQNKGPGVGNEFSMLGDSKEAKWRTEVGGCRQGGWGALKSIPSDGKPFRVVNREMTAFGTSFDC